MKSVAPQPTDQAEREYYRKISVFTRAFLEILKRELDSELPEIQENARAAIPETLRQDSKKIRLEIRMDATDKDLKKIFARVQKKLGKLFPDSILSTWAVAMVKRINDLSKKNLSRNVKKLSTAEIEPLLTDKGLSKYFSNVVAQNVSLIKSIPEDTLPGFHKKLSAMMAKDKHPEEIHAEIMKYFDVTRSKAMLLARDQTSKLNGALDQHRQTQMGVEKYIWRTMGDERVRDSHRKANGKVFRWDDPKVRGSNGELVHPKQDYQCRCFADPILDDLIE